MLRNSGKNPDGRITRVLFTLFYVGMNGYVAWWWWKRAQSYIAYDKKSPAGSKVMYRSTNGLSEWVPVAKFFGGMMCLNFR
jgi:hypothetical protein